MATRKPLATAAGRTVEVAAADTLAIGSLAMSGAMTTAFNEAPPLGLPSSSVVNIGSAATNSVAINGTTTITGFDAAPQGAVRRVLFQDAMVLAHDAIALILPGAVNILTVAGDVAEFESIGSGLWRCISYLRASGTPVIPGTGFDETLIWMN